jgi:tripartite-type tricarboxylate transporter receptor subunit TctC
LPNSLRDREGAGQIEERTREKWFSQGIAIVDGSPVDFAAFLKNEMTRWRNLIREGTIKPDRPIDARTSIVAEQPDKSGCGGPSTQTLQKPGNVIFPGKETVKRGGSNMTAKSIRLIALSALVLLTGSAWGQYPNKPIKLIAPLPAGTATDTVARILANSVTSSLGQTVLVENRAGADGAIAGAEVVKAPPDGYTLLFGTNSPMAAVPALRKVPPYDPVKDFSPIALVGRYSSFLWVNAATPVQSLRELIDYARANPGKLNYATGNTGGIVAMAQMLSLAGNLKIVHVPYKGEPAAILDLVSNLVQVMFATPTTATGYAKEGKLRVLATTLPNRSPGAPEVPTMAEAGLPKFSISLWAAIYGPARMHQAVVDRLSHEINLALNRPEVKEQLERQQFFVQGSTPKELETYTKEQLEVYSRTLREAGVQPE